MPGQKYFWRYIMDDEDDEDEDFEDDEDIETDGTFDRAELSRQAAVVWLLLSIDKKLDPDKLYRLDELFGLSEDKLEKEDKGALEEWREMKALAAETCGRFLASLEGLDANERYDAIVDEIDKYAENADVSFLWGLVRVACGNDDYAGNKRRILKRLCRRLGLDNTVLPALETAAKALANTKKDREDLVVSDKPYREVAAAIAALDIKEKETRDSLEKLGVVMPEISEEDDESGEDSCVTESFGDKVGDAVVDIIVGVTDGITGVIDGFTNAFIDLL
jgi:hypothetical protein